MTNDPIIDYFLIAVVFYFLGCWVGRTGAILQITRSLIDNKDDIKRVLQAYEDELAEGRKEEGLAEEVTVEKHGEQLFLYTSKGAEFISQGTSLEEALEQANKRFPDRSFKGHISKDQAEQWGINVSKSQF